MRATSRLSKLTVVLLVSWALFGGVSAAPAQSPSPNAVAGPDAVPDDLLTLVVGTRFVATSANDRSAKDQFSDARIPLASFNETDHCVDQRSLELAKDYFTSLGRALSKAGHYYFVPDADIKNAVVSCEKLYGRPPQAWVERQTLVIAFGKVVPTSDAPELEKSIR